MLFIDSFLTDSNLCCYQFLAPDIECSSEDGRTLGFVYSSGAVIGRFELSDECRSGALDAIKALKAMGIKTAMLTGDNQAAATHAQVQVSYTFQQHHYQ